MTLVEESKSPSASGSPGDPASAPMPETSIVIRAFNEERWLPELFAALGKQRYRNFEVLVVDSGSVDRTREIADRHGARMIRLRSEDFTFGYSLNIGIEQARGSLIAIISAHAIPTDEDWLQRLVGPLNQPANAMVFGGQRGHAVSKFSEARDFERVFHSKPLVMDDDHVFVNNANSAIKKSLWMQHRFDEGLPGLEDAEWAKYWIPRGLNVIYEPSACVYHVHTESWAQVRHRFHREGIAGRWTAVRIMRHIPREIGRELWWGIKDLALAFLQGRLTGLAHEIAAYRYNKTVGIVKGILDSRVITNPSKRAELHFDKGYSAVVIRGTRSAEIEPRSIPRLKPGEILVRVAYAGLGRADLELFEGRSDGPRSAPGRYAVVPGREISGTVVSLGKKVTDFREGDRVVVECFQGCGTCAHCKRDDAISCQDRREIGSVGIDGGCAEYFVATARYAIRIPEQLTLQRAALAAPAAAVMKGLRRLANVGSGGRCAVVGCGAVGHIAAEVLRLQGRDVTIVEPEHVRGDPIDGSGEPERHAGSMAGFDLIIETTGDSRALMSAMRQSRSGSTLLLLGMPYKAHELMFEQAALFDKTIVGSMGSSREDFNEALAMLERIDLTRLLQRTFPFEGFKEAWLALATKACPNVMLKIDPTLRH